MKLKMEPRIHPAETSAEEFRPPSGGISQKDDAGSVDPVQETAILD